MITGEFPPNCGGIGYYVYNLSKALIQRGHELTVLTRGSWNHKYLHEYFDDIDVYRVRFIPVYPFHVKLHSIFLKRFMKELSLDFDIIHLHSPLVPAVEEAIPKVVTEHNTTANVISKMKMSDMHSIITRLFSKIFIDQDIKTLKSSDRIVTISYSCARDIINEYGIKKTIHVVKNGVDTRIFIPSNDISVGKHILYTGRLVNEKGLFDLVECARHVCKDYPSIKFVLVGKGPIEGQIRKKINNLDLKSNFELVGYINDRNKLINYYQNSLIYVLPSYSEGLPTTLLEAMSCGIASIATDVGGCSEVMTDGKTGLLVPSGNPRKLADAILDLLSSDGLRAELGSNAREYVVSNHDWEVISALIEDVYIKCVQL
jgi:glycosyltransferase involved in cell wall biosynthesis